MHGSLQNQTSIYVRFVEKNKCVCTKGMLENGLMYSYEAFISNVINASSEYTN